MSRNKLEGRYAGCVKGWHVRGGKQSYEFNTTKNPTWGKCRHILGRRSAARRLWEQYMSE